MKPERLIGYYQAAARKTFDAFCNNCAHPDAYASWIAHTYAYVTYTAPTMRGVAINCTDQDLRSLLNFKANEEMDHDEMVLADLLHLGFELPDFTISPQIQRLIEITKAIPNQHDYALSDLVGHMIVLEVMHPSAKDIAGIASNFGIPVQATTAFRVHSELDTEHSVAVSALLNHDSVSRNRAFTSSVRVLQLFRDHWLWMTDAHRTSHGSITNQ